MFAGFLEGVPEIAEQFATGCRWLAPRRLLARLANQLSQSLTIEIRSLLQQSFKVLVSSQNQLIPQGLQALELLAKVPGLLLETRQGGGDGFPVLAAHLLADELQLAAPRLALSQSLIEGDGFPQIVAQRQLGALAIRHFDQLATEFLEGGHFALEG